MRSIVISRRAQADLKEIAAFIAADNPKRAVSFIAELRARCQSLSKTPMQGRPVPDIGPNLRILVFRSYLILHRVLADRIVHTARDRATFFPDG